MEENNRLVKVYSNNSKKSRLKRSKNKFQRIWDPEKGTYVKVRKSKYPVNTPPKKKEEDVETKMELLKRRNNKKPLKKAVEKKAYFTTTPKKQPARIVKPKPQVTSVKIHGIVHVWDSQILRYKRAA